MIERLRRDPGLSLLLLALVTAVVLYAPTLGRGLVNHDDPWLVRDNWIVQHTSWSSVRAIAFDTSKATRSVLGAEYLPVRDVSVMLDFAVWGDWFPGFHITNLAVYLAAITLWFAALTRFGIDRKIVGICVLLWCVHPAHAESVAWLSERKGLLAVMFAGACALGYARFRLGGRTRWLVIAIVAAVFAVWSKAPAAFAVAALGGLEVVLPARRVSWRRSLVGLGAIAVAGVVAFVPVVIVALKMSVVTTGVTSAPAGWLAMAIGIHGFYLELGSLAVANAPSYPIRSLGPAPLDLVIGGLGLVCALGLVFVPRLAAWRPRPELRAASVLWLFGWFPASRLVLPLRYVLVNDRYLLLPTLGLTLAAATLLSTIASRRARTALVAAIALAAGMRTLVAQANWHDSLTVWESAVRSNPDDGEAWALYADQLEEAYEHEHALAAVERGLSHTRHPRLLLSKALTAFAAGDRDLARTLLREAADAGDPYAMINLATILQLDGKLDDALGWARRAVNAGIVRANLYVVLGRIALAAGSADEAVAASTMAYEIAPSDLANRMNLGLALHALHRDSEARPHLEACLADPALARRARELLDGR